MPLLAELTHERLDVLVTSSPHDDRGIIARIDADDGSSSASVRGFAGIKKRTPSDPAGFLCAGSMIS
jgi:hypothetical protein